MAMLSNFVVIVHVIRHDSIRIAVIIAVRISCTTHIESHYVRMYVRTCIETFTYHNVAS